MGLYSEFAVYNMFGGGIIPDLTFRPGGDHGHDCYLRLYTGKRIPVDIKANSWQGSDPRLRVRKVEIDSETLYIATRFNRLTDEIEVVGWTTGQELLRRNEIRTYRAENYTTAYRDMYPMQPLILTTQRLEVGR